MFYFPENMEITIKFSGKLTEIEGKEYFQVKKLKTDFTTTKFRIRLNNLFNGDKALGETMNKFLNDNWKDILPEIKPSINHSYGKVFVKIISSVFSTIPYNELFA